MNTPRIVSLASLGGRLDADISVSQVTRRHLVADAEHIEYGKTSVDLAAARAIAWKVTVVKLYGVAPIKRVIDFRVADDHSEVKISFATAKLDKKRTGEVDGHFLFLRALASEVIEPRVTERLVRQVEDRGSAPLGPLVVDRVGVTAPRRPRLAWRRLHQVAFHKGCVSMLLVNDRGRLTPYAEVDMLQPNAVVLPRVANRLSAAAID